MASKKKAAATPYGYDPDTIRALFAADSHRGKYETEAVWADKVRAVLDGAGGSPVPPAEIAEKAGLTRNAVTGGLRILREVGVATIREAGGVRLAKTGDERAGWMAKQAAALEVDIAAMDGAGKRFPDRDAVADLRAAADALLDRVRAAIRTDVAPVVEAFTVDAPAEPAAPAKPKRARKAAAKA